MIRGELVNLRAVERTDAGMLHAWLNDPATEHNLRLPASTVSLTEVQRWIEGWLAEEERRHWPACLVVELLDGAAIGAITLSKHEPKLRSLEIALIAAGPADARPAASVNALRTVADACFEEWNLHRISLRCPFTNPLIAEWCETAGFRLDARLREAHFRHGEYVDVLLFSVIEADRDAPPDD